MFFVVVIVIFLINLKNISLDNALLFLPGYLSADLLKYLNRRTPAE